MNGVLLDILVVLVAAKLAAEVAERVGLPAVVGEILAGLAIGPTALGLVEPTEVLRTLAEIGVILLLLQVGLEMDLADLGSVGRASLLVALAGVVLPFAGGFAVAAAFGEPTNTAIFVGAALTATSVGITARVFGDLRALATVEARTVLGAAVADDVLGLVILTVVVRLVADGSVSVAGVAGIAVLAIAFLVVTAGVGTRLAPMLFGLVDRHSRSAGTLVAVALAFALAFAELADAARLATVVGAFVAGLSLARSDQAERIRRDLTPVGHLFVPVFFLQIGIEADIASLVEPRVLAVAGGLLVVAVLGKLAAAVGLIGSPGDRLLVGLGMLPRGEVGLIFAGIGLREGILGDDLYAAVLLVVLVTTLVTPPLLGRRLRALRARPAASVATRPQPEGGWLALGPEVVDLRPAGGPPPAHLALTLGLRAALAAASARPGPHLVDWLGSLGDGPLPWDRAARTGLFDLFQGGNARSWRFLENTGLLERALPELADAVRERRRDRFELDPAHAVRFSLVDAVHERLAAMGGGLAQPEWLVLAALLVEVGADVATARQVVKRLDLGAAAEQEVALLVGENGLLLAAAARPDGLGEERVLQIAAHLDRPERARALWILSHALGGLETWQAQRLDALHGHVQQALAHPELAGREAANVAEHRRSDALHLVPLGSEAAERLRHAPRTWLLNQRPDELARLATLVEPLPRRREPRVTVGAVGAGRYRVEVACRDQRGLLAAIASALTGAGMAVVDAVAVTWPDGGAADAFTVTAPSPPD
ncbi:MAG: cation:proton antiporter, partial [Acidimicrobiales bacterium]